MSRLVTGSLFLVAFAVLVVGIVPTDAVEAAKENVTFRNRSSSTQHVLAAFGSDGECSEMPTRESFEVAPREKKVLESGSSPVCYCTSPVGGHKDCGDYWKKVKPGRTVDLK